MTSVAIVDDHELVREGMISIISRLEGYSVEITAANGQELHQKLKFAEKVPEIFILDINMPVMNGYQTMEMLHQRYPQVKVMGLSMYDNEISIVKMLRLGAKGYLKKDCSPQELKEALRAIRDGQYYHPDINVQPGDFKPKLPVTEREIELLSYCCTELSYKEIAERMFVGVRTVHGYRDSLFEKLNLKTRAGLAVYALKAGIVLPASHP